MNIFGWMADNSGCGYYRISMPLSELRKQGHQVSYSTKMNDTAQKGNVDVIVGQRVCEPGPSVLWQKLARRGQCKMVFELDDDLWSIEPENVSAHQFYDSERQQRLIENITVADLVTVSTDKLAEIVGRWNANVAVLPNCVSEWLLNWDRPQTDLLTIGWGGSPSHTRDFGEMAKPIKGFLNHPANRATAEFHCIGPDFTPRVAGNHGQTRHTGWFSRVEPYLQVVDFDIGVIPLRENTFNDSKSYIKALELASLGIPVIVSGTGPYRDFVRHGETGLLVSDHGEWRAALSTMANNPEVRAQMGRDARKLAAHHTIESNAWRWGEVYS